MKRLFFAAIIILMYFTGCENQEQDFADFDYTTVYFAYQSPIRTITLGDNIFDTSLDNEHKCEIMATTGGVYSNSKNITLDIAVDNTLCDNLKFGSASGSDVVAMPSSYYSLKENKIVIPSGDLMGGVEVQLTDAFFADERSITNTYVIPLRITNVTNADSILSGRKAVDNPDVRVSSDWITVPKNYTLYAVKYVNQWHGSYLRRGINVVKGSAGNSDLDTTIVYHAKYVEKDEVCKIKTKSLKEAVLSLTTKAKGGTNIPFELVLTFGDGGTCAVSTLSENYTVSGSGAFVEDGDMWGDTKRDVLHLKYNIDFGTTTHSFTDTLVVRDRGVIFETFAPVVVE